ncbi:MAG: NADH-quinone oxidoreductase subunit N [Planctomycetia bacterium]|nr:NADH-quinone oxidoreductase subunit N [Planctomycetia bacterium]
MNPTVELANVYLLALPEIVLTLSACLLFLAGTFRQNRHFWAMKSLGILGAAAFILALPFYRQPVDPLFALQAPNMVQPIVLDRLALLLKIVALIGGAVLVLFSWNEVSDDLAAEYHACLLVIIAGVGLSAMANDLIILFLALEMISIPTYVILYLQKTDLGAREAAAKYFLLSVFSTGLLLFGFSYLYGLCGTTNITALLDGLRSTDAGRLPLIALVALVMVVAGLGFKITAVPFHFYAPDVYQGTSLTSAALLAFVPKVAGFAALLRVLDFVWPGNRPPGVALGTQAPILFWILAAMTMTVGNVLALLQDNLKRILAYSSVAHAGYMLIGLATAPELAHQAAAVGGGQAVVFYLVSYGAMTVGAFAVLAYLSTPQAPIETVDDLAGVSRSHPAVALMMAIFLFSLIGMPLTAGFAGKFFLFLGALEVRPEQAVLFRCLALIAALNAAAGAWYYLRIIAAMYLRTPLRAIDKPATWPGLAAIAVCAAITVALGVYPTPLLQAAKAAVGQ